MDKTQQGVGAGNAPADCGNPAGRHHVLWDKKCSVRDENRQVRERGREAVRDRLRMVTTDRTAAEVQAETGSLDAAAPGWESRPETPTRQLPVRLVREIRGLRRFRGSMEPTRRPICCPVLPAPGALVIVDNSSTEVAPQRAGSRPAGWSTCPDGSRTSGGRR